MSSSSNLYNNNSDSASKTKKVFDRYFNKELSFPSNDVDAVIGFFVSRKFELSAAQSIAGVLLEQAKFENIPVTKLLDTLKGLDRVTLSSVVTGVLNSNRSKLSKLGIREDTQSTSFESRNILY